MPDPSPPLDLALGSVLLDVCVCVRACVFSCACVHAEIMVHVPRLLNSRNESSPEARDAITRPHVRSGRL